MKKLLCAALAAACLLCACRKNDPAQTTASDTPVTEPTSTTETSATSETSETSETSGSEPLYLPETYEMTTVKSLARYPDIELSMDVPHFGAESLDELLDAYAVEQLQRHIPNPGSLGANGETATYKVTAKTEDPVANGKLYSAVFFGTYTIFNADGDRVDGQEFAYTVNVDLAEKTMLGTAEILSDYGKLVETFRAGRFAGSAEPFGTLDKYRPEYGIYPDVFFDGESFCIVVSPESFGEKAEVYTIPVTESTEFLNEKYR